MTIRAILVDDEKLAIQGLQLRLEAHDDVEIIDTCQNGREAIRKIKTHQPDLVFVDEHNRQTELRHKVPVQQG